MQLGFRADQVRRYGTQTQVLAVQVRLVDVAHALVRVRFQYCSFEYF
jgi:hypothetical protein